MLRRSQVAFVGTFLGVKTVTKHSHGYSSSDEYLKFRVTRRVKGKVPRTVLLWDEERSGIDPGMSSSGPLSVRRGTVIGIVAQRWPGHDLTIFGECSAVAPTELIAASQGPKLESTNPPAWVLAGDFGWAHLATVDSEGKLVGLAQPKRVIGSMSMCPNAPTIAVGTGVGLGRAQGGAVEFWSLNPLRLLQTVKIPSYSGNGDGGVQDVLCTDGVALTASAIVAGPDTMHPERGYVGAIGTVADGTWQWITNIQSYEIAIGPSAAYWDKPSQTKPSTIMEYSFETRQNRMLLVGDLESEPLSVSPDGTHLAAIGRDTIKMVDLADPERPVISTKPTNLAKSDTLLEGTWLNRTTFGLPLPSRMGNPFSRYGKPVAGDMMPTVWRIMWFSPQLTTVDRSARFTNPLQQARLVDGQLYAWPGRDSDNIVPHLYRSDPTTDQMVPFSRPLGGSVDYAEPIRSVGG